MTDSDQSLNAAAIDAIESLCRRAQGVRRVELPAGASEVVAMPNGDVRCLDEYMPRPVRVIESPNFKEVASFTNYVQRFERDDSVVFFEKTGMFESLLTPLRATAVIDYHEPLSDGPAAPQWCDHHAVLKVPYSLQWRAWAGQEGRKLGNAAMARFLEQNCEEIAVPDSDPKSPDQGAMMDVALKFEARRSIAFRSSSKLQSGDTSLVFQQETTAGASKEGSITVPQYFWIRLRIIEGGDLFEIKCWFRYRIEEGGELLLWFEFHRGAFAVNSAIEALIEDLSDKLIAPVFVGAREE